MGNCGSHVFSANTAYQLIYTKRILYNIVINAMAQATVNRELVSLGADLTSTDFNKGCITCTKSKIN